jgi:hypothetical protein
MSADAKTLTLLALLALAPGAQAAQEAGANAPKYADQAEADAKNPGCLSCHTTTDRRSMHRAPNVKLACVDCHGGQGSVMKRGAPGSSEYQAATRDAHVAPRDQKLFADSRNPERSYTGLLDESRAFVRFVNPGDLRVAGESCGMCHAKIVEKVATSTMTHSAMLYGAALYNNGVVPFKTQLIGESYDPATGKPRVIAFDQPPSLDEQLGKGWLEFLVPFPRWELSQTGNPFRVFERGGRRRLEIGLPDVAEEAGKPDKGLSPRGMGTFNRTDPIVLGAQKTRLVDPLLSLMGTNDHPGDYRSSGCTACHVVYANDRSKANSGPYAAHGNRGTTITDDPALAARKGESGHPLRHELTTSIPSSQCMTCHMHPGTNMVATYLGYTWWDNEADAHGLYDPKALSLAQRSQIEQSNPEGSALRGKWGDPAFLADFAPNANEKAKLSQFGDFHGHGWVFRGVYKKDRKGNYLDPGGAVVEVKTSAQLQPPDDPPSAGLAVHLKDIHLEKGMHCVDCHFEQDSHGDGHLYGEPRSAIEIDCIDCHGTEKAVASLRTSGPASKGNVNLKTLDTPFGKPRFEVDCGKVVQRSVVDPERTWIVPQVVDINRGSEAAQKAHESHDNEKVTCYACHSAWTTSCFGCHLSMRANEKKPMLHSEGGDSRNWTSYNFQTLRDDIYFLARDGNVGPTRETDDGSSKVLKNRIAPARSACAILVSSQNQNREWIYSQQQTVSSGGFSGQAFSTYVPHTVRGAAKGETKTCSDCHVSTRNDNNAWLASLVMQGTGLMNFIGRFAYVGEGEHGFEAAVVTEHDEPQAVIGSDLHAMAYPKENEAFVKGGRKLQEAYHHGGDVRSLQLRGEYLFAAQGKDGLRIYDVAQIDQKGFSERMVSAPVSPLGQKLYVDTKDATSVALPTTMTVDPTRQEGHHEVVNLLNQEQQVHPLYNHAYVTDAEEGLVVVGPLDMLLDGDPRNNFVKRAPAYLGPSGELKGATSAALAGQIAYVTTPDGVAVVDLYDGFGRGEKTDLDCAAAENAGGLPCWRAKPMPGVHQAPVLKVLRKLSLREPRAAAVQFRYLFVVDAEGLKAFNVDDLRDPKPAGAPVALEGAASLYLARTYAYVAAGKRGLCMVDIERPEAAKLDQCFDAGGTLNDAHDVKLGFTNGSGFAYVADGKNGLRVVEIISANETPGAYGFSPRPTPKLVATYKTHGPALALSRGLDRDRAVDETGNQVAVFGRRGARPLDPKDVDKIKKPQKDPGELAGQ